MSHQPAGFDDLIAPLSRDRFRAEYWTAKFLHQSGARGRFTPILPWEALNRILQWHSPPQPALRLFQEGAMVDLRRYIDGPVGRLKLNAGGLIALLGQGASMILDSVEEVSPAVAHLTANMQAALDCPVTANLFAGWRAQRTQDMRWDAKEVFILQLSGRQRWQVFAPTRVNPLADDVENAQPPSGQPLWDGILNDGDMLYLPRGFWHSAIALDEPSLHLSLGAQPAAGADFLQWWMRGLRRHADIRQELPNADAASRKAYMDRLMSFIADSANGDPVGDFLGERQAERRTPLRVRLPDAPIEQMTPLSDHAARIRLATQNSLFIEHPAGEPMARFVAAGNPYFIRPEFIAVFQRLSGHESVPLDELAAMVADPQLIPMLVSALDSLAAVGVVFKEGDAGR